METTINQNILEYAVGRKIFCPSCETILDAENAVLVGTDRGQGIACGPCFDVQRNHRYQTNDEMRADGFDVIDGRELT